MKFHKQFKNIHKGVLRATDRLLHQDLYSDPEQAIVYFGEWADTLASIYNIEGVRVELHDARRIGYEGGGYVLDDKLIWMTRPSLLLLFHQWRHHMQCQGRVDCNNSERDAMGWAYSLLFVVSPRTFNFLVCEGALPVRMDEADFEPPCASSLSDEEQQKSEEIWDGVLSQIDPDSDFAKLLEEIAEQE